MGKPCRVERRQRVVDFGVEGHSHRAAATLVRVLIKVGNDRVLLKRGTGSLEARQHGNGGGHGKLAGLADRIGRRIWETRDQTLDGLGVDRREVQGVDAPPCLGSAASARPWPPTQKPPRHPAEAA